MRTPILFLFLASTGTLLAGASCSPTQRSFGTGASSSGGAASSSAASSSSSSGAVSSSAGTGGSGGMGTGGAGGTGTGGAGTGGSSDPNCAVPGSPVDCSDPACKTAGYACTPSVPAGWMGPVALYTGASPPPGCGIFWMQSPFTGGVGVSAPPASCSACACGAPTNQGCASTAPVEISGGTGCAGGYSSVVGLGGCVNVGNLITSSAKAGPVPATGGGCAPSGGKPTLLAPTFVMTAALCAPETTGGGCTGGLCVPPVPAQYGSAACIYQSGDVACPSGAYPNKTLLYSGFADGRGCTACACGAPVGSACQAQLRLYEYQVFVSGCSLQGPILNADGACTPESGTTAAFELLLTGGPSGGACAPSGGLPTGTATGAKPTTVCCG